MSCILISHILGEVLRTCDRIVVMRDGKVVVADAARNFDSRQAGWRDGRRSSPKAAAVQAAAASAARGETPVVVRVRPERQADGSRVGGA